MPPRNIYAFTKKPTRESTGNVLATTKTPAPKIAPQPLPAIRIPPPPQKCNSTITSAPFLIPNRNSTPQTFFFPIFGWPTNAPRRCTFSAFSSFRT
ncbi:hypothetical protein LTR28_013489 [Elasticomyces elasticus]|nr:hypothetical protein LTR28_013489 [Elasticomyces elasticus]